MAVLKCKMCGGDLNVTEGMTVVECEYCGSVQTVPSMDNEKKMTLFVRANRLRAGCEFDKASGVYESIVAEFPEEAEAYWGLVLCKYGIEYVDDPATGKKIPTCHRSGFDSVMDDSDFEQACENADAIARRVYREEAKAIEELRRGIISVSSNEQPYDIFICYKETDENGGRTLDSVLAQDIYDALTEKGYRVFFSRITLEDKLGTEYEPYIFAALHSAKIMLAVGTDYEYYNAVWVKNEWSRFLKLMAADKSKHLIPCFKGIDAYDIPKEFARLQAQDMGKVGAMQDLLRGIDKILGKSEASSVPAAAPVPAANVTVDSLLKRVFMFLEDGNWDSADEYCEKVLDIDPENAQAYLGKALTQECCHTLSAFIQKRKEASQGVHGETLYLEPDTAHINEAVKNFTLSGYVYESDIRNLYEFDLSYRSDVTERQQQYKDEQSYWDKHKWLAKAEKFATGEVAETLAREKNALFAALNERVTQAEANEDAKREELKTRYAQHLKEADAQAAKCRENAEKKKQRLMAEEEARRAAFRAAQQEKHEKCSDWSIALGNSHTVTLKSDGTVVAVGKNDDGQYNVSDWIDIVAVAAGNNHTVGLKANGTVVAVGYNKYGQCDVSDWTDIVAVAVGYNHTVGLKADGTVVAVGYNKYGQCDVSDWTGIVAVAVGNCHTVGLKADGTVVAVGYNNYGQCDVSDWTNIKLPK